MGLAQCRGLCSAGNSGFGKRCSQLGIRGNKGGARNMQTHHLHQHLIGIGGAIKRAGTRSMIRACFDFQ